MEQIRLLTRTFFARLFESDLMPEGLPQVQLVLWGALLAATPTSGYPLILTDKYAFAQFYQPLAPEFDADRMILITLSMMAIGVVGLVIWDGVFPDRRDVRILGSLPIARSRFVIARLAALSQVYVLFAVPVCLLQSIIFPNVVAGYGDPLPRLHGVGAHLVTVAFACTFVFCTLVATQCLLLLAFGRRAAQGASVAFQVLFAVGLVQLLFFLGELGRVLREGGRSHEGLTALAMLPPTWFFGLYETLAGTADASSAAFGRLAVGATLASAVLAVGLYASTYGVLSRRALEDRAPQRTGLVRAWTRRILEHSIWGSRGPVRKAVRQFSIRTIARSRTHRMMLAVYAGVALAVVISSAVSVMMRADGAGLWRPGLAMLSMPLVFQFFLLIAIRVITAIPSEPKARWVFRACEPQDRVSAVSGTRDTMMRLVVLPTALFALVQGLLFWDVGAAIAHAAFCGTAGTLLTELLLVRTAKLPFACTYYPGKARVFGLWPLYVIAFFVYTLVLAEVDRALIARPFALVVFCASATVAARLLALYRRWTLNALTSLRFEEEDPDAIFQGFALSEAMAAMPKTVERR
jgi:hypothetical protein